MTDTQTVPTTPGADSPEERINITPEAAAQAKKLFARKFPDNPNIGLRMGVRGGGCSGLSYFLDTEDTATERDFVYDLEGVRIFVDKKSFEFLKGTTITWSGNLMQGGFEFDNPNAKKSCGCGTSFTT